MKRMPNRPISNRSLSNILSSDCRYPSVTLRVTQHGLLVMALLSPTFTQLNAEEPKLSATATDYFAEVHDLSPESDQLIQREVSDGKFTTTIKSFVLPHHKTQELPIPTLERFTTVNAFKLSHSGHVVGFAARPLGDPRGSQRAFVWNWQTGKLVSLGPPAEFRDSCAFDISADGHLVSGFVLGRDPPRIIPCVWERQAEDWTCQLLPTAAIYNPFLSAGHVAISDDGQAVAASVAKNKQDQPGNHLRIWRRDKAGHWHGQNVTDYAVHIGNINNQGVVVGRITQRGKRVGFVYEPDHGVSLLKPLPGDASTSATDVNNQGTVIGISDDPPGPTGGSTGFRWNTKTREVKPIQFGRTSIFSTARIIDDKERIGGWLAWQSADSDDAVEAGAYVLSHSHPEILAPKSDSEPGTP